MTTPSTAHEALRKLYKYALLACNGDKPQDIIDAYNDVRAALPEENDADTLASEKSA